MRKAARRHDREDALQMQRERGGKQEAKKHQARTAAFASLLVHQAGRAVAWRVRWRAHAGGGAAVASVGHQGRDCD